MYGAFRGDANSRVGPSTRSSARGIQEVSVLRASHVEIAKQVSQPIVAPHDAVRTVAVAGDATGPGSRTSKAESVIRLPDKPLCDPAIPGAAKEIHT